MSFSDVEIEYWEVYFKNKGEREKIHFVKRYIVAVVYSLIKFSIV